MPDFTKLLSTPVSDIHKPKPLPAGTFLGNIKSYKFDEITTREAKEKRNVANLTLGFTSPMDDVDQEALAEALVGRQLTDITRRYTLWLTDDAQYRAVELAESLGIDVDGKTLGELFPLMLNQPVYIAVSRRQNDKTKEEVDNIDNIVTTVAQE